MKRQLRVKTGIVVPSRPKEEYPWPSGVTAVYGVPLIRCTTKPPCSHCWYCQQARVR